MKKIFKHVLFYLFSTFGALIIGFYFTKKEAESLWSWFMNQVNPLTYILLFILLVILLKNIIWDKIRDQNNKGLKSDDQIRLANSVINSNLTPEDKIIKKLAQEIKADNNLQNAFENVIININKQQYEFFENDGKRIEYFLAKDLIQNEKFSRLYFLTERGYKVSNELLLKSDENQKETKQKILNSDNSEKVKKIAKEIMDKKLKDEYLKVIMKINDFSGDFADCNLELFLIPGLILRTTKTPLRGYNFYSVTELGQKVKDALI
jgi:hypothetical protein